MTRYNVYFSLLNSNNNQKSGNCNALLLETPDVTLVSLDLNYNAHKAPSCQLSATSDNPRLRCISHHDLTILSTQCTVVMCNQRHCIQPVTAQAWMSPPILRWGLEHSFEQAPASIPSSLLSFQPFSTVKA